MDQVSKYRGWILVAAIAVLLLPTYVVWAEPILAQNNNVTFDFSWLKDLPPIIVLCVLMFLVLRTITDRQNQQNQVTIKTPEGQPDKVVSVNEMIGMTFSEMLKFMQQNSTQANIMLNQFSDQNKALATDLNHHTQLMIDALTSFKDELIQGRNNQLTAIMGVSDDFKTAVTRMEDSRTNIAEKIERLNGGVGYLQIGQSKMQNDLGALLSETKKLTTSINDILGRLEHIDVAVGTVNEATLTVQNELRLLAELVHSLDQRLNKISIAAGSSPVDPLSKPDVPANKEP